MRFVLSRLAWHCHRIVPFLSITTTLETSEKYYAIGFAAFLLGFVADLLYEIWHASVKGRNPLADGFGIYIAAAGVFVHSSGSCWSCCRTSTTDGEHPDRR